MDEKIQRFLSKADWQSLLQSRPVRHLVHRQFIKKVHFQPDPEALTPCELLPSEDVRSSHLLQLQKQARYKALKERLATLAQPKASPKADLAVQKWSWAETADNSVGPGQYETRLDLTKPCHLSTKPNHPIPVIRKSTSVGRARERDLLSPARPLPDSREKGDLSKAERSSMRRTGGRQSFSRSQGRVFDLKSPLNLPDVGSYSPLLVPSQKYRYSVPKSVRKFNISRCILHSDSLLNEKFNSMFLSFQS